MQGAIVLVQLSSGGDPSGVHKALHGVENVKDVRTAVLEIDGSISIVPLSAESMRTRRHQRFLKKH